MQILIRLNLIGANIIFLLTGAKTIISILLWLFDTFLYVI